MQVRYKTNVPIAHKGDNGKTTIRSVPFYYDQQEWQPKELPDIGQKIGFKNCKVIFRYEDSITSCDGVMKLFLVTPVEPIYPPETIDEMIRAGWCVLKKEFVVEK